MFQSYLPFQVIFLFQEENEIFYWPEASHLISFLQTMFLLPLSVSPIPLRILTDNLNSLDSILLLTSEHENISLKANASSNSSHHPGSNTITLEGKNSPSLQAQQNQRENQLDFYLPSKGKIFHTSSTKDHIQIGLCIDIQIPEIISSERSRYIAGLTARPVDWSLLGFFPSPC